MRLFIRLLSPICLIWLIGATPVLATTDPSSATTSATATVPATVATDTDTISPTTPILIRPQDDSYTANPHPEFVWRESSDPNGNTLTYTLYLNGVATYLGISNLGNSSTSTYTSIIEDHQIKLIPKSALPDGAYRWYVTATDSSLNSTPSTIWDLVIDTHPPLLTLTSVDIYHDLTFDSDHPEGFSGLNFDLGGPKDIYFSFLTERDARLELQFLDSSGQLLYSSTWTVGLDGLVYPYQHLALGRYSVLATAVDRAQNAVALPSFTLTLTQAQITVPFPSIPGVTGLPDSLTIPYTPLGIPTLPATVSFITTRPIIAFIALFLLAVGIIALLVFILSKKYNIIFLDSQGHPLSNTIVYHSLPTTKFKHTPIFVSTLAPISYLLESSNHGRLYIPHLSRYSTLTIRQETRTYILSLSAKRRLYTLILG